MPTILDVPQYSDEWWAAKRGKPSASKMDRIITSSGKPSKQREGYLWELAAERISGISSSTYQSQAMLDGIEKEAESRQLYELIHEVEVEQVGMIYQNEDKDFLCSPDGVINREYGLEIKTVLAKTQVGYLLVNKLPRDYFVQVQSSIFISEFSRWDFFSNSAGLPPLIIKVERDVKFCAQLKVALDEFCEELDDVTEKLRRMA